MSSSKNVPNTIEELFENWHGEYHISDDMKDWDNIRPIGRELW